MRDNTLILNAQTSEQAPSIPAISASQTGYRILDYSLNKERRNIQHMAEKYLIVMTTCEYLDRKKEQNE